MTQYKMLLRLAAETGEGLDDFLFVSPWPETRLHYTLFRDSNGTREHACVEFRCARAYRRVALHQAGPLALAIGWESWNSIVEVVDSAWLAEMKSNESEPRDEIWKPHHYVIVSEELGVFEVAASDFRRVITKANPLIRDGPLT